MSKLNHARHAHRGRQTEMAFSGRPKWNGHQPAKAANKGRSLSRDEIAAHAASLGIALSSRAA